MSGVKSAGFLLSSLFLSLALLQNARAADILVTTTADSGNGTLRQAIQFNNSTAGGNTILFTNTVVGQITLTNPLGELVITKDVTILGPGAKLLAINGNRTNRVLHIADAATVFISDLTVTNGYIDDLVSGGGIVQDIGSLTLSNCVIAGNTARLHGGGIYFGGGNERLVNCTFSGNSAGGIMSSAGAGLMQTSAGTLEAVNCTFAGNLGVHGAGLAILQGTAKLTNCTISGNHAFGYDGGGIYVSGGTVSVRNTIIAGNVADSHGQDCFGAFTSLGFNLIGKFNDSTGWGAIGDQLGTTNAPIDAVLGPLADNGGSTPTMSPLRFYSPAIDQGNSSGISTDQRGRARSITNAYVSSIPLGGDRSDIGAYEISPATIFVTNTNDSGPGSLRQTIPLASPNDVDTVSFASNVVGTITLTSGELLLTNNVNIVGPGADRLAISGNMNSRVFHATNGDVLIADLTITKGTNNTVPPSTSGGGIFNEGSARLTVSNCVVTGNSARRGGGIANTYILYVYDSAIMSNLTFGAGTGGAQGAGIHNLGYAWIQDCTISGNVASGGFVTAGGGIYNSSSDSFGMTLYFCTIASNAVVTGGNLAGGGVFNAGAVGTSVIDPIDCIIANNSGNASPDVGGDFPYSGFDLIGKADGSTGFTNGVNYNFVGSIAAPLDPRLGPLKNNGGHSPTHALLPDSLALDKGVVNYGGSDQFDQRGAPRGFILNFVSHTNVTDGSDIGAFELATPALAIQRAGTDAIVSWPAYYGDFTLESTTNLAAPNSWIAAGAPAIIGDNSSVTNGPIIGNKFFRLKSN